MLTAEMSSPPYNFVIKYNSNRSRLTHFEIQNPNIVMLHSADLPKLWKKVKTEQDLEM